jgi:hypothetical protein
MPLVPRSRTNLQDKLWLLLAGIVLFGATIGMTVFMTDYLLLQDKWLRFVNASFAYSVASFYSICKYTSFRRFDRIQKITCVAIVETLVPIFFVLFYVGILPLPEHMFPSYFFGILLLIVVIISCFNMLAENHSGMEKQPWKKWNREK